jgi:hypothetical protein
VFLKGGSRSVDPTCPVVCRKITGRDNAATTNSGEPFKRPQVSQAAKGEPWYPLAGKSHRRTRYGRWTVIQGRRKKAPLLTGPSSFTQDGRLTRVPTTSTTLSRCRWPRRLGQITVASPPRVAGRKAHGRTGRALVVATYSRLPKSVVQYCCSLREGNLLRRSVLGSVATRKITCGLFRGGETEHQSRTRLSTSTILQTAAGAPGLPPGLLYCSLPYD